MSLADELLADLEDVGEGPVDQVGDEDDDADVADVIEDVAMETDTLQQSVKNIAKLLHSEEVTIAFCCDILQILQSYFQFYIAKLTKIFAVIKCMYFTEL